MGLLILIVVFITSLPILANTLPESGIKTTETTELNVVLPVNNSWDGTKTNLTNDNGTLLLNDSTEGYYLSSELTNFSENEKFEMERVFYETDNIRLDPPSQARTINLTVQTSLDNFTNILESREYSLEDGPSFIDVSNFSRARHLRFFAEFNSYSTDDSPELISLDVEGTRYTTDRIGADYLNNFIFLTVVGFLLIILIGWATGTRRV